MKLINKLKKLKLNTKNISTKSAEYYEIKFVVNKMYKIPKYN